MPKTIDQTDVHAYIETAMRGRLDDLQALHMVIDGDADQVDEQTMRGLDIGAKYDDHELTAEPSAEDAERALYEWPLAVEATTTFEIVLGTGGPDDRLLIECDVLNGAGEPFRAGSGERSTYEIRRVLYRYSWGDSAEVVLSGEDRAAAERYARELVPELADS